MADHPMTDGNDSSILSKRKLKKELKKAKLHGSNDIRVQCTNDDSVVSKRSAVLHGYFTDGYLRHFVKKISRRSPLINRGYYLRMKVMTDLITNCLRLLLSQSTSLIQIVSLGAGYDTLAFRLLADDQFKAYRHRIQFYDVDFPDVMKSKASILQESAETTFPSEEEMTFYPEDECYPIRGAHYSAIGIDLRQSESILLRTLQRVSGIFSVENPTIVYAECVMQYMPSEDSAKLIQFLASNFPHAIFFSYDQINPSDSFGETMLKSLKQKGSALLSISKYPDGKSMIRRALDGGMQVAKFADFFELGRYHISGPEKDRVEKIEAFDESEEWSEMCEHYGITFATTDEKLAECDLPPAFMGPEHYNVTAADVHEKSVPAFVQHWPSGRFSFEGWGHGVVAERREDGDIVFISFGGHVVSKGHQRVNIISAHSLLKGELKVVTVQESEADAPPALVFHSMTRICTGLYIVLGGRTNPSTLNENIYLLNVYFQDIGSNLCVTAVWKKLNLPANCKESSVSKTCAFPPPRYRHTAVALDSHRIFVYGGRASCGCLLGDSWVLSIDSQKGECQWRICSLQADQKPPSMCSAAGLALSSEYVLISGGLEYGEKCNGTIWKIDVPSAKTQRIVGNGLFSPRYSHTMAMLKMDQEDKLLILGGSPCEAKYRFTPALLLDLPEMKTGVRIELPPGSPTWTRHCCIPITENSLAIIGGGFTCFSFGTFSSKPCILSFSEKDNFAWRAQKNIASHHGDTTLAHILLPKRPPVEECVYTPEAFVKIAKAASHPIIFRKVNLGSCVELWRNEEYLKAAEKNTVVSVHVAEGNHNLDFVKKNFTFRHVPFPNLVDHVARQSENPPSEIDSKTEHWYYRSVATNMKSERSNLWRDFPSLGKDFQLPDGAKEYITPHIHQSCLRINSPPLQLWTHFDTLDNVLCQIVGKKRVILFPPSEYNNLYMTGSSSEVVDIDNPDLFRYPRFIDANKAAIEVILEPGDMLYFPSLWFHHVTTLPSESPYSISVNVFFLRMQREDYDKMDLYGNKDLPICAGWKEKLVQHVKKSTQELSMQALPSGQSIPLEFVEFTLREAIDEIHSQADSLTSRNKLHFK